MSYIPEQIQKKQQSAIAFLLFIGKKQHVSSMLTTHFFEVCKQIEKVSSARFQNYFMETEKKNKHQLQYTYQLRKGISQIKGGCSVLYDLQYPKEILDQTC